MKELTKKQYRKLVEQAEAIRANTESENEIREVLAQIYVENMEGKTLSQGRVMADEVLADVRAFDEGYGEAQKDMDKYLKQMMDRVDEGKTCVQRCNFWLKTAAAVSAASAGSDGAPVDRDETRRNIEEMNISGEEASEELASELRAKAAEAMMHSGIMFSAFTSQEEMLEEIDSADEAAELLLEYGEQETEYRAIVSMLAYTNIKNGTFRNMPADTTAAQTTTLVCAQIEQMRIADAVGKGNMAVEAASMLLTILGVYVVAQLILGTAIGAGIILADAGFSILITGAGFLALAILTIYALTGTARLILAGNRTLVHGVAAGVKTVLKGIRAAAAYIRNKVIPGIVQSARRIYAEVRKLFAKCTAEEEEVVIDTDSVVVEG